MDLRNHRLFRLKKTNLSRSSSISTPSLGPFEATTGGEMVSRRRILSRSRDDLTQAFATQMEEEEDVWYQKDKLYKGVNSDPLIEIVTGGQQWCITALQIDGEFTMTLLTIQCQVS
ncbi:hypothetical protein KGM_215749 [Danaus plexippus plexippus]|uniref:Uncharacterized protein n=1 Tax=Danaus plexippus plexippus TaxID=278856 RepID=A0A212FGG2_DANPL|nr:hypothetical protein KGM_215749 [Danaus plexippus plexippus]